MENILFNSTVFLEFLDCTQSVRVLPNLELKSLAQSSYHSVFAHSLYLGQKEALCFFSKLKQGASDKKNNYSLK